MKKQLDKNQLQLPILTEVGAARKNKHAHPTQYILSSLNNLDAVTDAADEDDMSVYRSISNDYFNAISSNQK